MNRVTSDLYEWQMAIRGGNESKAELESLVVNGGVSFIANMETECERGGKTYKRTDEIFANVCRTPRHPEIDLEDLVFTSGRYGNKRTLEIKENGYSAMLNNVYVRPADPFKRFGDYTGGKHVKLCFTDLATRHDFSKYYTLTRYRYIIPVCVEGWQKGEEDCVIHYDPFTTLMFAEINGNYIEFVPVKYSINHRIYTGTRLYEETTRAAELREMLRREDEKDEEDEEDEEDDY